MANAEHQFLATTALGMEKLLADELVQLGAKDVRVGRSKVAFAGPLETGYRACLWSRVANRILLPLQTFPAPDPDRLYAGIRKIHWTDHLTENDTLAVEFHSQRSQITHTHYGTLKVKDAIVDQFRAVKGVRPSVQTRKPDLRVYVYLENDEATVSIDLSGESLHRRGYREDATEAPLKENLAAALLYLAGWPKERDTALLDPMCGSGTLPIEAALMFGNVAPGLRRDYFGFLKWQGHIPVLWKRLLHEAQEKAKEGLSAPASRWPKIVGYDHDVRAVRIALGNLQKAGVHGKVHIEKRDLSQCEAIAEKGIWVCNPPYGERLGDLEELKGLYQQIGDTLKHQFKGWEAYVFTVPELGKSIGLKTSRKDVLYNGALECRWLKFDLY